MIAKVPSAYMTKALIVFLGMLAAIAPLSTDMYLPALPAMMADFSVTPSMIQMTLTASMAGMAVGQIFAGPASDGKGRKGPLTAGMLIFTVSTIICACVSSISVFLVFRFIQGFSGGAGIVIARAIARDVCKGPALTRFFSILMLVNGIAPILAPVIGGQILRVFSWRGIFLLLVLIGIALTAGALLMRETLPAAQRISGGLLDHLKSFGSLFGNRYFMGHCIMQCFAFAAFFAYISGSSFVFQNIYGVSAQMFSYIFGMNGIGLMISGALVGKLTGCVEDWKILRISLYQALIGSLVLLLCFIMTAPLLLVVLVLFLTIPTLAALSTSSFSMAMQAQGRNAGGASALIGFFSMISGAVMAPLVGIAGSYTALPMGLIMAGGEIGAMVAFYLWIYPFHKNIEKTK
ncbi:multidrug effflux MFS transporter [Megasphaera sueciensis]|uniref:multidrug effflux MFS transporter n=1 Tax=Megasphaera sueciensis TaxID=349094 RepID=UPI003D05CC1E|nr:multidrug effflux MFS transporter [Megasphaera sp.]